LGPAAAAVCFNIDYRTNIELRASAALAEGVMLQPYPIRKRDGAVLAGFPMDSFSGIVLKFRAALTRSKAARAAGERQPR
jgi:hypothetical protein